MRNVLLLLKLNVKQNFQRLRKRVNRQEWTGYGPTTMNALYNCLLNEISEISYFTTVDDLFVS